jgi:hypothetical protein
MAKPITITMQTPATSVPILPSTNRHSPSISAGAAPETGPSNWAIIIAPMTTAGLFVRRLDRNCSRAVVHEEKVAGQPCAFDETLAQGIGGFAYLRWRSF